MLQVTSAQLNIILMLLCSIESAPVNFEFHHRESFSLTDDQDWGDNEDYGAERGGRARRSAAKWAPDYDLYAQWAEEYYRDDIPVLVEEQPTSTQLPATPGVSGEGVLTTLLYLTYAVAGLLIYLVLKRIARWSHCCNAASIRERARRAATNLVPGVYVHPDGRTELYTPSQEELEAAKELSKLLYSIY